MPFPKIQVLAVINEIPNISGLVNSLYDCRYRDFMVSVVELSSQLESDRYFARHSTYLVRELRILAYTQVNIRGSARPCSLLILRLLLSRKFLFACRTSARPWQVVFVGWPPRKKNCRYRE